MKMHKGKHETRRNQEKQVNRKKKVPGEIMGKENKLKLNYFQLRAATASSDHYLTNNLFNHPTKYPYSRTSRTPRSRSRIRRRWRRKDHEDHKEQEV